MWSFLYGFFHSACSPVSSTYSLYQNFILFFFFFYCCSVTQSSPTLCKPLDCSTPSLPVLHHFPEFTQTHVHSVGDAPQPSHPLSSPSPPAFNLSQHQGLFQWVSSSHEVAKVLEVSAPPSVLPMNIQDWFPLELTNLISLQSKGLSRVFSNTTVRKHQFFSAQSSLWSNSHIHTWLLEKLQLWLYGPLSAKWCLCYLGLSEKQTCLSRFVIAFLISIF